MADLTIIIAFVAGIISFLSPCVLPLIPGFLAYLAGSGSSRGVIFLNAVCYVLGFASVFAILGVLLNSVLGGASASVQTWLSRLGGVLIIVFGLQITGLISIPFLGGEHAPEVKRQVGYTTSFLFGAAFAVGWSPCVGPVLGSVLALASTQPGSSFALLLAYALGLGLPFLVVGAFSGEALSYIRRYNKVLKYFNIVVGGFLIVLGVLVFTQTLSLIANFSFVNYFLLKN